MSKKWSMVIDVEKCIGCHACSAACRMENKVSKDGNRSWVTNKEVGEYPNIHMIKLAQLCNHCDDAPCIPVCPVDATWQDENGVVVVDDEKCIGCFLCVSACPYGARIKDSARGIVDKCDFCQHRVENGLIPACISTCTPQARYFGDINDPNSKVSQLLKSNNAQGLLPELNIKTNVHYTSLDKFQK